MEISDCPFALLAVATAITFQLLLMSLLINAASWL